MAGLAAAITQRLVEQAEPPDSIRLLAELEGLSEEEARGQLVQARQVDPNEL